MKIFDVNNIAKNSSIVQNFFLLIIISLFFLVLTSCTYKVEMNQINESFEEKYGSEIDAMLKQKGVYNKKGKIISRSQTFYSTPPTRAEVERKYLKNETYQGYVGVEKYVTMPRRRIVSAREVYQAVPSASSRLPDDMFYITYNTQVHPPFSRIGKEFDQINIPRYDAYGVKTEMSEKIYLLAGNGNLQKTIDEVRNSRTADDPEISKILIEEANRIQNNKRARKIFGKVNYFELQAQNIRNKDSKLKKTDKKNEEIQLDNKAKESSFSDKLSLNMLDGFKFFEENKV
jgi:hypothetical protein